MTESGEPLHVGFMAAAWNAMAMAMRRRTVLAAALGTVTAGLMINWSALVAAGIAPLIISALPCAVMCALGLCMSGMSGRSCTPGAESQHSTATTAEDLQFSSLAGLADGPEAGAQSVDQRHVDIEPHNLEQKQERRPVNA
jgi:hypothetical protein